MLVLEETKNKRESTRKIEKVQVDYIYREREKRDMYTRRAALSAYNASSSISLPLVSFFSHHSTETLLDC